ncbi:MAG: glycosyltransferase [Acetanaerobacterium sp.]
MGKYNICVYAICKNEERFVERWMDSVSEADLVVVTDTGSTDSTVERLRARGAVVYTEHIEPWRFDTARNLAMDHIPLDVDICVPSDLDEVFERGWRNKLEDAWRPEYTRARYRFNLSVNPDGTPRKQYLMEKIHRRQGFRWAHPVHEVLEYSGSDPDRVVWVDMVLNHYPDNTKSRRQYLPLLELSAAENPSDDRTAFWLGREYVFNGRYDLAIMQLKKHLALPAAQWKEERSASMRYLAHAYDRKGDAQTAKAWLFRAIAECAQVREPYYDMLKLAYRQGDWTLAVLMVQRALDITHKSGSYLTEEEAWGVSLYDLGAIACYHLELYEQAYEYAKTACDLCRDNKRLRNNLILIDAKRT